MNAPRIEKRKNGWVLVADARVAPFGYVRDGKLRLRDSGDTLELSPEDLRELADKIEAMKPERVVKLRAGATVSPV